MSFPSIREERVCNLLQVTSKMFAIDYQRIEINLSLSIVMFFSNKVVVISLTVVDGAHAERCFTDIISLFLLGNPR